MRVWTTDFERVTKCLVHNNRRGSRWPSVAVHFRSMAHGHTSHSTKFLCTFSMCSCIEAKGSGLYWKLESACSPQSFSCVCVYHLGWLWGGKATRLLMVCRVKRASRRKKKSGNLYILLFLKVLKTFDSEQTIFWLPLTAFKPSPPASPPCIYRLSPFTTLCCWHPMGFSIISEDPFIRRQLG